MQILILTVFLVILFTSLSIEMWRWNGSSVPIVLILIERGRERKRRINNRYLLTQNVKFAHISRFWIAFKHYFAFVMKLNRNLTWIRLVWVKWLSYARFSSNCKWYQMCNQLQVNVNNMGLELQHLPMSIPKGYTFIITTFKRD